MTAPTPTNPGVTPADDTKQATDQPNRVLISGDGTSARTIITNATTGEPIQFVQGYTVTQKVGEPAHAVINVLLPKVKLECNAVMASGAGQFVTPAEVEATIASEHYFTAADGAGCEKASMLWLVEEQGSNPPLPASLSMLTFCVLVTRNGHTVTGESHCQNPAKFDAAIGRNEARKEAVRKLWDMVVYAARLDAMLAEARCAAPESEADAQAAS